MIEAGQYYTGRFVSFDTVQLGSSPAMQFTLDIPGEGHKETTCWLTDKNRDWVMGQLVLFGCDSGRLTSAGWREHISETLAGREFSAKAEEYNGKVNLKGIYASGGGGKKLAFESSPFASAPTASDDSVPF